MSYSLVTEIVAHQSDVRALAQLNGDSNEIILASGGRDRILHIWKSSHEGKIYSLEKDIFWHEHLIPVIMPLPNGHGFVTGCHDNKIRIFDSFGELKGELLGHSKGVYSLSFNGLNGDVISGSWDGTAKIWKLNADLSGGVLVKTLPNHENSVCVLGLPNGTIVTGSAGYQSNNQIIDFQIRLFDSKQDYKMIRSLRPHSGSIRNLALNPSGERFLSCGNDGVVCEYNLSGDVLRRYTNPIGMEGQPAYIFSLTVHPETLEVITANDDMCIRLYSAIEQSKYAEISHPCSVWDVKVLSNGDIATAGSDGTIRIFTSNESRIALPEILDAYSKKIEEVMAALEAKRTQGQNLDPSKFEDIRLAKPGNKDGQTKMFNKDGKVWVYTWSAYNLTWNEIGEAMGSTEQTMLDGVKYDKILSVEVEDPASGGIRAVKFGINQDDNPYVVAQQFCATNNVPMGNVQQIVDFINSQRGTTSAAVLGVSDAAPVVDVGFKAKRFPLFRETGYIFDSGNIEKVFEKLKEFNDQMPNAAAKLSPIEQTELEIFCETLADTRKYHSSSFSSGAASVIEKMVGTWDINHIFPVFDLIRLCFVHPEGISLFPQPRLNKLLVSVSSMMANKFENDKQKLQVALTAVRVLCNVFMTSAGAEAMIYLVQDSAEFDALMIPLTKVADLENKVFRLSYVTFFMNLANALSHSKISNDDVCALSLDVLAKVILPASIKGQDAEATERGIVAVACLLSEKLNEKKKLSDEELNLLPILGQFSQEARKLNGMAVPLIDEFDMLLALIHG